MRRTPRSRPISASKALVSGSTHHMPFEYWRPGPGSRCRSRRPTRPAPPRSRPLIGYERSLPMLDAATDFRSAGTGASPTKPAG